MNAAEARTLLRLLRGQPRRGSHAQRLQAFYGPQAPHYDAFRERLLQGRQDLIERLRLGPGSLVVELGGGTGQNLLFFGARLEQLERIELVDLCPALLDEARKRFASEHRVRLVEADACSYRPERPVDCVYLSYSLTMIPDWRGAIDNALSILRPGGTLGVVDFYVSERRPDAGLVRHGALSRFFWPRWFAHDGVHLNPAHLPCLRARLPDHELLERRAPLPYLPGISVPYYVFVGRTSSGRDDTRPSPGGRW